ARTKSHGAGRGGESVRAHTHGGLVAGGWRFRRVLPDERDHRAEDRADRSHEGWRAGSGVGLATLAFGSLTLAVWVAGAPCLASYARCWALARLLEQRRYSEPSTRRIRLR